MICSENWESLKNMLKNNIDISLIQKCTGLSFGEVKKIKMKGLFLNNHIFFKKSVQIVKIMI